MKQGGEKEIFKCGRLAGINSFKWHQALALSAGSVAFLAKTPHCQGIVKEKQEQDEVDAEAQTVENVAQSRKTLCRGSEIAAA